MITAAFAAVKIAHLPKIAVLRSRNKSNNRKSANWFMWTNRNPMNLKKKGCVGIGTLLPSGNESEWPLIEAQLTKRGIQFMAIPVRFGRLYLIPKDELSKLPQWKGEPYLPVTDDEGHSIYPIFKRDLKVWKSWKK